MKKLPALLLTLGICFSSHGFAEVNKDVQVDILIEKITSLIQEHKETEALPYFAELEAMGVALPEAFYFYHIDALDKSGDLSTLSYAEAYVNKYGKKGKYYAKTLPILMRASERKMNTEPKMIAIPAGGGIAAFELGETEVTQAQWLAIMGSNPSSYKNCGANCPVEKVSWEDIQVYLQKLNAQTGKNYRLPTEKEWFYACQAGNTTQFCGSNNLDAVAWHEGNSGDKTHPVKGKQANAWGLYDMTGNVWEKVNGCWDGSCRALVSRGGAYFNNEEMSQTTQRGLSGTKFGLRTEGFRVARTLP